MSIYKVVLCALSGLIFTVLLKKVKEEYALFTVLFINLSLMTCAIILIQPVLEYVKGFENTLSSKIGYTQILFKCTGIGLLCSFASELCRDCSQSSLAGKIELLGKCGMICYCLPIIKTVFEYALKFIS